jgi:hypothetical protein
VRRALPVQQVADDLGKHPKRAEDAGQRNASTDLKQVGIRKRLPDDLRLGVDDGRDFVRHVVDGEEVIG